jgi:hypothetical protein
MPSKFSALVAAVLMCVCGAASAEVVTFSFSGTVSASTPMASAGSTITGSFSYETDHNPRRKDLPPGYNHTYADYAFTAPFTMAGRVNGHAIETSGLTVAVFNNNGGADMVDLNAYPAIVDGTTFANGAFGLVLVTTSGNTGVLHNTRLPRSYAVSQFDAGLSYGYLQTDGGQAGQLLQFTIDAIDVVAPQR